MGWQKSYYLALSVHNQREKKSNADQSIQSRHCETKNNQKNQFIISIQVITLKMKILIPNDCVSNSYVN